VREELLQSRAAIFLDAHPELREAQARSEVFPRIREQASLAVAGRQFYLVYGDTLGDEEELFLDRLARGARDQGADRLSRELFLELSPELQEVVRRELLREDDQHS
jgi:hypothetical protein